MTQDEALALLKTGTSMFLTGEPGSGKTHTVNRYIDYLRRQGAAVAFTASTGIAATHGHGVTIHAWSGIGVRHALSRRDLDTIATNRRIAARIEKASVLVIDEISMLPARALDLVDEVCRHVRDSRALFGGLQVIFVGDFFQLPPVVNRQPSDSVLPFADGADGFGAEFAYASRAWRDLAPTVSYLTEQHRQDDADFLRVLTAIRANACAGPERARLLGRRIDRDRLPRGCPRLFTHNAAVDDINLQELAKLSGETHPFVMTTRGPEAFVRTLQRGCLSPESLDLKEGAVVMFTKNDPGGRYVNGTLGTVVEFEPEDGNPVVRTLSGRRIVAEPATWKIDENGRDRASVTQVPLRLAWAITVHKSQGMSLDAAVIDLSRAFEYGQGYVALSRLRTLSGLHLLGLNERALRVHPEAVAKDAEFRAASELARQALGEVAKEPPAPEPPRPAAATKSYDVGALRESHGNAYAPWSRDDDLKLEQRHRAGGTVAALAAEFGRKPGAIRSRLKKLGLG
jgi:ATP-dependent DNA helicase PIF1